MRQYLQAGRRKPVGKVRVIVLVTHNIRYVRPVREAGAVVDPVRRCRDDVVARRVAAIHVVLANERVLGIPHQIPETCIGIDGVVLVADDSPICYTGSIAGKAYAPVDRIAAEPGEVHALVARGLDIRAHVRRPVLVVANRQELRSPWREQHIGVEVGIHVSDVIDIVVVLLEVPHHVVFPGEELAGAIVLGLRIVRSVERHDACTRVRLDVAKV